MRGLTLPFAPTKTHNQISIDLREKFLSLLFSFLSPSAHSICSVCFLSISLFLFFLFPFLFFFSFFSFLIFSFIFAFFFHFFFSFGFSFSYLNGPKSGKLPPHFLLCHLSFSFFFLFFFISLYFPHVTHGSM